MFLLKNEIEILSPSFSSSSNSINHYVLSFLNVKIKTFFFDLFLSDSLVSLELKFFLNPIRYFQFIKNFLFVDSFEFDSYVLLDLNFLGKKVL